MSARTSGRVLLPDCCTWCGHAPHTTRCTVTGCPCAYRKDPR